MKLYHGTSEKNAKKIIEEGFLRPINKKLYLSLEKKYSEMHGEIVFEVEYNPYSEEMKVERLIDGTPIIQVVTNNKVIIKKINRNPKKDERKLVKYGKKLAIKSAYLRRRISKSLLEFNP